MVIIRFFVQIFSTMATIAIESLLQQAAITITK